MKQEKINLINWAIINVVSFYKKDDFKKENILLF